MSRRTALPDQIDEREKSRPRAQPTRFRQQAGLVSACIVSGLAVRCLAYGARRGIPPGTVRPGERLLWYAGLRADGATHALEALAEIGVLRCSRAVLIRAGDDSR